MNNETRIQEVNNGHSSGSNCSLFVDRCSFLKLKLEAAKNSKPGSFIYR
jgi:hypothetical protein